MHSRAQQVAELGLNLVVTPEDKIPRGCSLEWHVGSSPTGPEAPESPGVSIRRSTRRLALPEPTDARFLCRGICSSAGASRFRASQPGTAHLGVEVNVSTEKTEPVSLWPQLPPIFTCLPPAASDLSVRPFNALIGFNEVSSKPPSCLI